MIRRWRLWRWLPWWAAGGFFLGSGISSGNPIVLVIASALLFVGVRAMARSAPKTQPAVVDAAHRDLEQDHMLARLEQRYAAMPDPDWAEMEREAWAVVTGEAAFEETFRRKLDREVQKKRLTVEQARDLRQLSRARKEKLLRVWSR